MRKYSVGANSENAIPKDTTSDKPWRFRVSCEARTLGGDHVVRFVMRDREKKNWIGRSIVHHISYSEWRRVEAHFVVPPVIEAELRIDDEGVSAVPSTLQPRKLMMTEKLSE